jgi:hypothetical protein
MIARFKLQWNIVATDWATATLNQAGKGESQKVVN